MSDALDPVVISQCLCWNSLRAVLASGLAACLPVDANAGSEDFTGWALPESADRQHGSPDPGAFLGTDLVGLPET